MLTIIDEEVLKNVYNPVSPKQKKFTKLIKLPEEIAFDTFKCREETISECISKYLAYLGSHCPKG